MNMRRTIAWALVIPIGPPIILYVFTATLLREMRSALWFAWNDAAIEIAAIRRDLSGATIKDFDE
jgi:hypothetical protein